MKLRIKPFTKNNYPIAGFLIKNPSVKAWLMEIQQLKFSLGQLQVFPIPGTKANTIWGCFVIPSFELNNHLIGKNELCQKVFENLYIPEKTILSPYLTPKDKTTLFPDSVHVFHPEFGLAELTEKVNFEELILLAEEITKNIIKPKKPVFIPKEITAFQVKITKQEDILEKLEENIFPKHEELEHKPLNIIEKTKFAFYKTLFKKTEGKSKDETLADEGILTRLGMFLKGIKNKNNQWLEKWKEDFEQLHNRNKKELDRLLDMLKDNPEEALKYAIPLDDSGSGRGELQSEFRLFKRWGNFSLFNQISNTGKGGYVDLNSGYDQLNAQYRKTAEELTKKGDFQKAAFIYMKLLKNYYMAAHTLEQGGLYAEAAVIYLKYANNKSKAAECFEKAKMLDEAIKVYEDLAQYEKVGDLYMILNNRQKAVEFYEKAAEVFKTRDNYVQASLLYKNKIMDKDKAQKILLEGWDLRKNAYACLNTYFSNILDVNLLKQEINAIYKKKTNDINRNIFLNVLHAEFIKENEIADHIKEIAYEIIVKIAESNRNIVTELKNFNLPDKEIVKDINRYRNIK